MEIKKFYGEQRSSARSKSWERKRAKLEHLASEYRKHPIPWTRIPRIGEPLPVFSQWFPRQRMAFEFARTCHKDVHVFAEERSCDGKRHYLVSTLPAFWDVYRRLDMEDRHYYEVITQGAACRLYFDLEFKRDLNPDCSGPEMVEIFKKLICRSLYSLFKVKCEERNILDLDSSTTSKFSRHLIFHIPGAVFQDNINAGNFVHHVCALVTKKSRQYLESSQTDDPSVSSCGSDAFLDSVAVEELAKLMVKNDKGEWTIFCDQGVYTKNRNFRLYKSTKMGRNAPLLLAKENQFKVSLKNKMSSAFRNEDYLLFLESLICNVSPQTNSGQDVRVITCESCRPKPKPHSGRVKSTDGHEGEDNCQSGNQYSPYPDIDRFISNNISRGGVKGHIRRWVYFQQGKTLTYDILNNRWCENIGRPHKSNHIMMVVDLEHGVYYQKCHDPDCRRANFRSEELPLPDSAWPFSRNEDTVLCSEEEDDELLCRAAAEGETLYQLQCNLDLSRLCSVSENTSLTRLATSLDNKAIALEGTASHSKTTELQLESVTGTIKEQQKIAAEHSAIVQTRLCGSPSTCPSPLNGGGKPDGTQELLIDEVVSKNIETESTETQGQPPTCQNKTFEYKTNIYCFNKSKELNNGGAFNDYIDNDDLDDESVLTSLRCLESRAVVPPDLRRTQVVCGSERFLPRMLKDCYEADIKTNNCEDVRDSLGESHQPELEELQTLINRDKGQNSLKPNGFINFLGCNTNTNDGQISEDSHQGGFVQKSNTVYCSSDGYLYDPGMLSDDPVEEQLLIQIANQIETQKEAKLNKNKFTQSMKQRKEKILSPFTSDTSPFSGGKHKSKWLDHTKQFAVVEVSTESNIEPELNDSFWHRNCVECSVRSNNMVTTDETCFNDEELQGYPASSYREGTPLGISHRYSQEKPGRQSQTIDFTSHDASSTNSLDSSWFVGEQLEATDDKDEVELEQAMSVAFDMLYSRSERLL